MEDAKVTQIEVKDQGGLFASYRLPISFTTSEKIQDNYTQTTSEHIYFFYR
jgi:hypothetical protein